MSKEGSSSVRSDSTNQTGNVRKLDCFGRTLSEATHLLPHADVFHKAFGFLVEAAVGMYFTEEKRNVFKFNPPKTKRRKVLMGVR